MLPIKFVIELFLYLAILIGLYWVSDGHKYFKNLNRPVQIFLILFFYLLIVGQVNKSADQTYPFTKWSMYSQHTPTPAFSEHLITLTDGSVLHYPYEYVTFTSPRACMRKVEQLVAEARDENPEQLELTLNGLAEIYEKNNPGKKVAAFIITENWVTIPENDVGYELSNNNQFKYELE